MDTWKEIDGAIIGACPDSRGPIGGGDGYVDALQLSDATHVATTCTELSTALQAATSGDVVYIPGNVVIDMTAWVYLSQPPLMIGAGVTLASDRGVNGSAGALLTCSALASLEHVGGGKHTVSAYTLIETAGDGCQISGLRIRGPSGRPHYEHWERSQKNNEQGYPGFYALTVQSAVTSSHSALIVHNCDISEWSHCGIFFERGTGHHVHHCYIRDISREGLGYGVTHKNGASLIEQTKFARCRHSIAGSGEPGCGYTARHNVQLDAGPSATSHPVDMHKSVDDIGGDFIDVQNMYFQPSYSPAVYIRAPPVGHCIVSNNWFPLHASVDSAIRINSRIETQDNLYG